MTSKQIVSHNTIKRINERIDAIDNRLNVLETIHERLDGIDARIDVLINAIENEIRELKNENNRLQQRSDDSDITVKTILRLYRLKF